MKKFLALALALIMVFALCACGQQAAPAAASEAAPAAASEAAPAAASEAAPTAAKTIQLGITDAASEEDPYYAFASKFKELVEERTNGEIVIDIYAGALLGADRELFEGVQLGTVDSTIMTNAVSSTLVSSCGLFDLPFVFESTDAAFKVLNGDIGQKILSEFDQYGIKAVAWGEGGYRQLITTKNAVSKPEDIKGMKIRCMETQTYLDTYAELGVNATPMAFSEVVSALQQGTIDGLDIPTNVGFANGFCSTVPCYLNYVNLFYSPITLMFNLDLYNSLTAEQQEIINQAGVEAGLFTIENNAKFENITLDKIAEEGMCEVNKDVDIASFQAMFTEFYTERADIIGGTYVEDLLALQK